jgi:CubicO group peptidase (beta-lactamase class C family)
MKNKILTTILLTGLLLETIYSQNLNKPKLDSLLDILAEKNKAMGSLTISKNGSVLYSRAIGYIFISDEEKLSANEKTKYRIGSISKMFTATMIFQLIEEGKLNLTTTLDKYFPELPNASIITISNLLNHRSGLHNFVADPDYLTWMTQPKTHDEMLAIISKNKADFQPNEKASYSNSNYLILGYIIEKISEKPYSEELNKRIISKIGLINTYSGSKTDINNNESASYNYLYNWNQEPETELSNAGGGGGIVSTPTDLTKFIEALFSLKLVSQNSLDKMKTITDGYGMGMFQIPFYTKIAYYHGGQIDGFRSHLAYFPEDSVAVAYCSNGQIYPLNDILIGVLCIYFGRDYLIPTFNTLQLTAKDLDKYSGIYSNTQIPLKITIFKDNLTLLSQAPGEKSIPLEATGKDEFRFYQWGIKVTFDTDKDEFFWEQGGGSYLFTKDK